MRTALQFYVYGSFAVVMIGLVTKAGVVPTLVTMVVWPFSLVWWIVQPLVRK